LQDAYQILFFTLTLADSNPVKGDESDDNVEFGIPMGNNSSRQEFHITNHHGGQDRQKNRKRQQHPNISHTVGLRTVKYLRDCDPRNEKSQKSEFSGNSQNPAQLVLAAHLLLSVSSLN